MKGKGWRLSTGHRRGDHLSAHPGQGDRTPGALPAQVPAKLRPSPNPTAVTRRRPHSPVASATWPTVAVHSSSTNSSPSSAGRAMQPLASERGPAGAAAVSASSLLAPTSRPPRSGGQSRRRREGPPRPRPQVTRARGGAWALAAEGTGRGWRLPDSFRTTPGLPPCHHLSQLPGSPLEDPRRLPLELCGRAPRLASPHSHFDQDAWLSQVPKAAPCCTLGQGHVGKEPWSGNLETWLLALGL